MQSVFGYSAEIVGPDTTWCHEHIHPEDRRRVAQGMEIACQTGGTYWQDEFRYRRADGTYAHVEDRGMVMRDGDGKATRMVGAMHDISYRKELEDQRGLVARELSHRMNNSLAIIQAVVQQSARSELSLEEFTAAVEGRIEAMASANNALIAAEAESADLHQLIESQLSAFISANDRRVRIKGPSVEIPAASVPTFRLSIYELATNASKYGALSVPSGLLAVTWQIVDPSGDKPRSVLLTWRESGGPKVETPTRKGFGTVLIERGLLHAEVVRRFEPSGVVCTIEMRLQPLSDAAPSQTDHRAHEVGLHNGEPNVLVVEDEPLISAMLEDLLADSGFRVVALVADVASALRYLDIRANRVDLCILDISLRGGTGFEVAEKLTELGIAFLFSSGYGDVMNPRWQHVPVLRKPYSRSKLIETLQSTLATPTKRLVAIERL
jgi:PAS domain S-box-containing protein